MLLRNEILLLTIELTEQSHIHIYTDDVEVEKRSCKKYNWQTVNSERYF